MKAALIVTFGEAPVYSDFPEPVPAEDEVLIRVSAAALTPLTRSRAAGRHYTSAGSLPLIPGIDGVGYLADGRRVYFGAPRTPFGSLAECTVVKKGHYVPVPDHLDDITAAALANPGVSSWLALQERARLKPGETVLINGATGIAGRLAIPIARYLGASRIIVTGRNEEILRSLASQGTDVVLSLRQDDDRLLEIFKDVFREGIDVVLDYLWGPSAERLLLAAALAAMEERPVRFVQVGSISGETITLPAAVLRAAPILLLGSGIGSIPLQRMLEGVAALFEANASLRLTVPTTTRLLSEVMTAWSPQKEAQHTRTVFLISSGRP
ncbi:MAG: zinc-binding alcohol dehydrogenase family protein [Thermogemmatispora sp.]|uniref:quinone oxidoreductase family protein n=1 Tax=Thermogemmatispora sp. TaxID=1968838 RepID=UPI00263382E4|nr:zinc-binding alcohol dehydrogenase family protein [Thermogemmatispora sp.]MBX5456230.1 zinc-binding alcohol dehydrogenase family protein [Thermogemmatispora sp.]